MSLEKYIKEINRILEKVENKDMTFKDDLQSLYNTLVLDSASMNVGKAGKTQIKTMNKLIKGVDECRERFKTMFRDGEMYCFTNGFVGIELYNQLPGIPLEEKEPAPLALHNLIANSGNDVFMEEVQIDQLEIEQAVIKNKSKTRKQAKEPFVIQSGNIKIGFNPEYYQDIINCLGDNCKVLASTQNAYHPIYIKGELGNAILMPIRLPADSKA